MIKIGDDDDDVDVLDGEKTEDLAGCDTEEEIEDDDVDDEVDVGVESNKIKGRRKRDEERSGEGGRERERGVAQELWLKPRNNRVLIQ